MGERGEEDFEAGPVCSRSGGRASFRLRRELRAGDSQRVEFRLSSRVRGWLWPLAIVVLIFSASAKSTVAGPKIANFDKVTHFSVYGLLATLVCRQTRGWRGAAWAFVAVSAFGATDEIHQSFVPGRFAEVEDWVADTAGAAVAVVAYRGWAWYRQLLERPLGRGRAAGPGEPAVASAGAGGGEP